MSDEPVSLPYRLRKACNGHPNALIPWPHRILHDAADHIEELESQVRTLEARLERVRGLPTYYESWPHKTPYVSKSDIDAALTEEQT